MFIHLLLFYVALFKKFDSISATVCHNGDSGSQNSLVSHIIVFGRVVSGEEQNKTSCGVVLGDSGK